jgi:hypothetical protein
VRATTEPLEDRLTALRDLVEDLDLRARLDEVRSRAEDVRDDVVDRSGAVRDEVRDRVPELVDDLEPAVREARIKGWELLRAVIGALLVLPRVLVRVLGALPGVVETAAAQGGELAGRARKAASAVPPVQRSRRRRRNQLLACTAGGFVVGAVTGWLVARRQPAEDRSEATGGSSDEVGVPSVNGATPVTPDLAVRE